MITAKLPPIQESRNHKLLVMALLQQQSLKASPQNNILLKTFNFIVSLLYLILECPYLNGQAKIYDKKKKFPNMKNAQFQP